MTIVVRPKCDRALLKLVPKRNTQFGYFGGKKKTKKNSWMGITQYALEDTVVRTQRSASLAFDSQCQVNNK